MIRARNLFASITIIAAFGAVVGAAMLRPNVMGVLGIVAAAAAIAWGLAAALTKEDELNSPFGECDVCVTCTPTEVLQRTRGLCTTCAREFLPALRFMPNPLLPGESELPYRPADRRPTWDTATWGAPE